MIAKKMKRKKKKRKEKKTQLVINQNYPLKTPLGIVIES